MKSRVTETIYSSVDVIIPMSSVQHIEKRYDCKGKLSGVLVITDKTKWNFESDTWENAIYISTVDDKANHFLRAFCDYIAEKDGMLENPVYSSDK